jgi:hypothetical protein
MENFTAKHEKALVALLSTNTLKDAAAQSGISETTIYRYLQEEGFRRRYRAARFQAVESAVLKLQGLTTKAVETLEKTLNSENPNAACKAAQLILDNALKGSEFLEMEQRIKNLENLLKRQTEEAESVM